MASDIHVLTLDSHIAVLDAATGMGILMLPDPVNSPALLRYTFSGGKAESVAAWWFGGDTREHAAVLQRLSSIGWELPRNDEGAYAWFDAGPSHCCGRTTISLTGQDAEHINRPAEDLVRLANQIQQRAADACTCHRPRPKL